MNFEQIIRPFQTANIFPIPAPATVGEEEVLENIRHEFGRDNGQIKTMQGSYSGTRTAFTKDEGKEVSRVTSERRVENPDDPSQYVIVEDTDKIETESGKKDTYKYNVLELEKQED